MVYNSHELGVYVSKMAKIVYVLLCHKDPKSIIQQAERLTDVGDFVSIHFDKTASASDYDALQKGLGENPRVVFAKKRENCGWGEWSLVAATLRALEVAVDAFPEATHYYMLSGDCQAIKSAKFAHDFLDRSDIDYVESFDYFESDWIKTGMKEGRLIYRHFFNERTQKKRFYASMNLQKKLGLTREPPADIQMMIGSQWWCLRRRTIESILEFVAKRRDVVNFFKTTWIPDETFFQTLVRHLVPSAEIESRSLTFKMFTDYGMPVTFHNDHYEMLLGQDYLFARKISPEAFELKERLGALYADADRNFEISNEGERIYTFLTGRGRVGRRFAPRFWEVESSIGKDRQLLMVVCKKWHVAKRFVDAIRHHSDVPVLEFIFNEQDAWLPDLGGIEKTLGKRGRHRRSMIRMLFDYFEKDRLLICMDTANFDVADDFFRDRCDTRMLEIDCEFTDEYLTGHAKRIGLAADSSSEELISRILPTIRRDVTDEYDRFREAGFAKHYRILQWADAEDNAEQIAAFLDCNADMATSLANTNNLFSD